MKARRIEIGFLLFVMLCVGLLSANVANAAIVVTVTTDKPSYGRGALVGVSGAVTSDGSPASGRTIGIEIRNPSDLLLTVLLAETGSYGVYSAFFQLSGTADYGTYRIIVAVSGTDVKGNTTFEVSASPPTDSTPPTISNVAASAITVSSAVIVWTTDEPATSQVECGPTASYGSSTNLDQTLDVDHAMTISGLAPSTTYHFRVKSSDGAGNAAQSGDYTFTTTAQAATTYYTTRSTTYYTTTYETSSSVPEFSANQILLMFLSVISLMFISRRIHRRQKIE